MKEKLKKYRKYYKQGILLRMIERKVVNITRPFGLE